MKKFYILLSILIIIVTGCEYGSKTTKKGNNKYINSSLDSDGNVIIDTSDITSEATFINYEVDGVTIQLIVVRATDGTIRVAFNTCQVCNPSPNAYFLQDGDYLVCQNCGNRFHIDEVGVKKGGCNPTPVEELEEDGKIIKINKAYLERYKDKFENWNGPIK